MLHKLVKHRSDKQQYNAIVFTYNVTKFSLRNTFLTSNVLVLGIVSLLADLSTEMIQPILPLFLVSVLGSTYTIVGLVEGSSDATTSIVKVISGWYSDRFSRRKPFVVAGYLPSAVLKPLLYFVQTPLQVIAIRVPDRVGNGIREAPRDALIAESVEKENLGKAFGFHRALDRIIGNHQRWVNMLAFMKNYYPSLWNKWSSRIIEFFL